MACCNARASQPWDDGLRALLKADQERGPDFLRLANAPSALYLKESEEKRLLDAMLLAVPK
jgi:putative DNA methylase